MRGMGDACGAGDWPRTSNPTRILATFPGPPYRSPMEPVHVIGGGLAGAEACWQLARRGRPSVLSEMRPSTPTDAHRTDLLAELVCSNSFRSDDAHSNAVGLLHEELRRADSLILRLADRNRLPAGGALAVDREGFAEAVTEAVGAEPLITVERRRVDRLPEGAETIVATGPLTDGTLAEEIRERTGRDSLAFFDAIAPIVHRDSIDFGTAWFQSRYDKAGPGGGAGDYINCPLDEGHYAAFIDALRSADTVQFREWEAVTPYFEGCLPIEVMAARGPETLRFGPMKPVGLTDPRTGRRPHAVVQLRQDNALGTLFNIVGFQTKLKYAEQARVLRMVPGLEEARFARLGGIHRNTFIDSPRLLDGQLRLRTAPHIRFAGQITGVEGYVESAAVGLLAGRFAAGEAPPPPGTTALGALLRHITGGHTGGDFQPMNINFGLLPPPAGRVRGRERRRAQSARALADLDLWLGARMAA